MYRESIAPVDIVLKSSSPPPPSHIHLHNRRISLNTAQITHNANYRRGEGWASTLASAHSLPNSPPPYQLGFSGNNTPRVVLTSLDDPETRNLVSFLIFKLGQSVALTKNCTRSISVNQVLVRCCLLPITWNCSLGPVMMRTIHFHPQFTRNAEHSCSSVNPEVYKLNHPSKTTIFPT